MAIDLTSAEKQIITFLLAGQTYGQEIRSIREIIRIVPITIVPHTPPYVIGVVNLRGIVVPVVNMRRLLGLDVKQVGTGDRIIVVEILEHTVGLLVDAVDKVVTLTDKHTIRSPDLVQGADNPFFDSFAEIDGRLVIFLQLKKLLLPYDTTDASTSPPRQ